MVVGMEELVGSDNLSRSYPDPIVLELNNLHNKLKEKDRELGDAHTEIKALRAAEVLKEKAVEELGNEVHKLDEKLRTNESLLEQKNLDIKKLTNDKKEALAAQYAAEATVRRVHANQKDDDSFPVESVIAPLEAELKMYRHKVATMQEEKKTLERLTKSKEAALLEAEKILRSALERALIVEEVQNHNFELKRQIEICQEENKLLEKTNRQKVLEVEKLSETIKELEEAILAGGAAANTIRDYRRQISVLNDENRTLERELARIKVSANRVASVVANEWKDDNDKVMPVKKWLEERRVMQGEIQRLRDKLVISERTANSEAQLKDKLKLRLTTLEEGLKNTSKFSVNTNAASGTKKPGKSNNLFGIFSSNPERKRPMSQPRASTICRNSQELGVENETNKAAGETKRGNSFKTKYKNKVVNCEGKENTEMKIQNNGVNADNLKDYEIKGGGNVESEILRSSNSHNDDLVSGFLYDKLQKEVISLRKSCEMKDNYLNAKDEEIKVLIKKVNTLIKALEVESKKMKREAAEREKDPTKKNLMTTKKSLMTTNKSEAQTP